MNKQARKNQTAKVTLSAIAFLLILSIIAVGVVGYFSQGFSNWDTASWGKKNSGVSAPAGEGNGTVTESGGVYSMSSQMNFTAAASTAAYADYRRYITYDNADEPLTLFEAYKNGEYDAYSETVEYTFSITSKTGEFLPFQFLFNHLWFYVGADEKGIMDGVIRIFYYPQGIFKPSTYVDYIDVSVILAEEANPSYTIKMNVDSLSGQPAVYCEFGGRNLVDLGCSEKLYEIIGSYDSVPGIVISRLNDGTGMTEYIVEEAVVLDRFAEHPGDIPLPADPTKEGYTFTGWYFDEACTQKYNGTIITQDTVLYAGWEINTYIVKFYTDDTNYTQRTVNWNTAATMTNPTKQGFKFLGWYLPDGTRYIDQPIKEDTALRAKWEINSYEVKFDSNGGSAVETQYVEYNAFAVLPTPVKEGYTLVGWFMPDGTQYTNQIVTENMTLTARWTIKIFSVHFNSDGGDLIADQTVEYGNPATLQTPIRAGYDFKGWFLDDGTEYVNQTITSNTTLTAKWEIKRFKVTFYVDGEVYKETTVDYGTRLKDVADRAGVFSQNVVSYRFMNADLPVGEFGDMVVVDDMEVKANAPSTGDKIIGTIKNNWLPILLGGVGLVLLIAVISVVAVRIKRR